MRMSRLLAPAGGICLLLAVGSERLVWRTFFSVLGVGLALSGLVLLVVGE